MSPKMRFATIPRPAAQLGSPTHFCSVRSVFRATDEDETTNSLIRNP